MDSHTDKRNLTRAMKKITRWTFLRREASLKEKTRLNFSREPSRACLSEVELKLCYGFALIKHICPN